ncbi:MAG TPA: hypothetical protein VGM27_30075, partial [Acidobacteriaceae bacterium]
SNHIEQGLPQSLHRWHVVERLGASPLRKVHQADDSPFCITIPEPSLRTLDLAQRVITKHSVR